jgi:hypothetical protein
VPADGLRVDGRREFDPWIGHCLGDYKNIVRTPGIRPHDLGQDIDGARNDGSHIGVAPRGNKLVKAPVPQGIYDLHSPLQQFAYQRFARPEVVQRPGSVAVPAFGRDPPQRNILDTFPREQVFCSVEQGVRC